MGERVYDRVRKSAMKDLEPRWLSGIWLGRRWGSHTNFIYSQLGKVVESFAIQRRPVTERWSRDDIEEVRAYPWDWDPTEESIRGEVTVIPGMSDAELRARAMEQSGTAADRQSAPDPMHITKADLEKMGIHRRV